MQEDVSHLNTDVITDANRHAAHDADMTQVWHFRNIGVARAALRAPLRADKKNLGPNLQGKIVSAPP